MKTGKLKFIFTLLFFTFAFSFLQARNVKDYDVRYNQVLSNEFTIDFTVNKYNIEAVEKNGVTYSMLNFNGGVNSTKKGWAELPFLSASVQLPNNKNVSIEILDMQYQDFDLNYPMLPSRGSLYRNQDPSTIPYEIDPASLIDAWYPADLYSSTQPFIMRDVRGESIFIYPFQYNPVQNKLRVYKNIKIRVFENSETPYNPLLNPSKKVALEMTSVYSSMFINYKENSLKWTNEVAEYGEILVIYTSRDATVIQPWITWKKEMGYKVHELQVATGTNVKTNIQTQYNSNNGILYVLLVGDWADIKSDLGTSQNAPQDPMMGCVLGADNYHDIIIGRFSASTTSHVTIQGDKVINYEKLPDVSGTWYKFGLGIGSDEGTGIGDDSEMDQDHIDVIKENKLLPFTYTTVTEAYGASVPTSTVSNAINSGLSVINYCGHGAHDYWVTSNYSVSSVNSSTNGSKLPFVFSVACVVGEFHNGTDCLAEAMLRKSGGGSVATWMGTINQPWTPPMRGQDYANDILKQGYNYTTGPGNGTNTTYGKTTFGSITYNAAALMISESTATDDWDTYKTWTVFGDPSLQVRTETPKAITITNPVVSPGTYTTQIMVGGSPFKNALVSLYKAGDPQPFSGLTDVSGNVTITHSLTGTVKHTVTGFNLATYSQNVTISSPNPPVCDFSANQTTVTAGSTVIFTDLSTNYPTSWSWTFAGGTPASSTSQNPSIVYNTPGTYDVSLYVVNGSGNDTETKTGYIHVTAVSTPPVANFSASSTNISAGQAISFTDLSTNLPTIWNWTFAGGTPSSSTDQNPSNIVYMTEGTYTVTLYAENTFGNDTETKTAYITVGPNPAFSLDFEACIDYSASFSPWSVYDGDGLVTYGSGDCDFPGESDTMSFMAFNPDAAGFTLANPHGGVRCGMAICPADASQSDDWMISPQMTLGTSSSISLWVLSPKPGTWGNDSYQVMVSTTDNLPASFVSVSGATAVEAPATWTNHTYSLSAYDEQEVYIAIRHVATDKFMFWVDDIEINTTLTIPVYPTAGFTVNASSICAGGSVSFTNTSADATSYLWTFPGGSPATSTSANPTVTFASAGTYNVSLQAINNDGTDTENITIHVYQVNATSTINHETIIGANDGSINLTVSGGVSPYSFNWS
ncbi:MAG: C25 family cysteine peptidase, partial [Bacteroidota bacterium]